jgi:hypothetical protein
MTSATTPKTVELYGVGCQHEDVATVAITPGYLVERNATGVAPHSTAGDVANLHFAVEDDMVGDTIDDEYAIGANVIFKTYAAGSGIYAVVAAAATAITKGAFLASAGDGTLELAGTDVIAVAQALEAVDNSGGGTEVRIKVETIPSQRTAAA